jgi:hypothetical protein
VTVKEEVMNWAFLIFLCAVLGSGWNDHFLPGTVEPDDIGQFARNVQSQLNFTTIGLMFELGENQTINELIELSDAQRKELQTFRQAFATKYPKFFEMAKNPRTGNAKFYNSADQIKNSNTIVHGYWVINLREIISEYRAGVIKVLDDKQQQNLLELSGAIRFGAHRTSNIHVRKYHWPYVLAPAFQLDESQLLEFAQIANTASIELKQIIDEKVVEHETSLFKQLPEASKAQYDSLLNSGVISKNEMHFATLAETKATNCFVLVEVEGYKADHRIELTGSQQKSINQAYDKWIHSDHIQELLKQQGELSRRQYQEIQATKSDSRIHQYWLRIRRRFVVAAIQSEKDMVERKVQEEAKTFNRQIEEILLPHQQSMIANQMILTFLTEKTKNTVGGRLQWPLMLVDELGMNDREKRLVEKSTERSVERLNKAFATHDEQVMLKIEAHLSARQKRYLQELLSDKFKSSYSMRHIGANLKTLEAPPFIQNTYTK